MVGLQGPGHGDDVPAWAVSVWNLYDAWWFVFHISFTRPISRPLFLHQHSASLPTLNQHQCLIHFFLEMELPSCTCHMPCLSSPRSYLRLSSSPHLFGSKHGFALDSHLQNVFPEYCQEWEMFDLAVSLWTVLTSIMGHVLKLHPTFCDRS